MVSGHWTLLSYSDTGGGNVANQIQYIYDGWGNVWRAYQEHNGEVDTSWQYGSERITLKLIDALSAAETLKY